MNRIGEKHLTKNLTQCHVGVIRHLISLFLVTVAGLYQFKVQHTYDIVTLEAYLYVDMQKYSFQFCLFNQSD